METSRVGPFVIEESLRPDRQGSVYRAFHVDQRRAAAIKLINAALVVGNVQNREEFNEEMELLKSISHPNLPRFFGGSFVNMQGYLVWELIDGESLSEVLLRRERLSWDRSLEIARQICEALEVCHEAKIWHFDVCPDKIMIAEPLGDARLTDLRVNRWHNAFYEGSLHSGGGLLYRAPEIFDRSKAPDHKADLYSLGCVLFQMLTGQPPHQCDSVEGLIELKQTVTPPRVSSVALDSPVWIDVIVEQLLQVDPAKRPFGAGAVRLAFEEAIRKITAGTGVAEHSLGGFSALAKPGDVEEAKDLLSEKPAKEPRQQIILPEWVGMLWMAIPALVALVVFSVWMFWPLSEEQLYAKGSKLMDSKNPMSWSQAKHEYFLPLLRKHPDGEYAEDVRDHIDEIDMRIAETKMKRNQNFAREPDTEGESLYRDGWNAQARGDDLQAALAFRKIVEEIDIEGEDRPFVLLAKERLEEISNSNSEPSPTTDETDEEGKDEATTP